MIGVLNFENRLQYLFPSVFRIGNYSLSTRWTEWKKLCMIQDNKQIITEMHVSWISYIKNTDIDRYQARKSEQITKPDQLQHIISVAYTCCKTQRLICAEMTGIEFTDPNTLEEVFLNQDRPNALRILWSQQCLCNRALNSFSSSPS